MSSLLAVLRFAVVAGTCFMLLGTVAFIWHGLADRDQDLPRFLMWFVLFISLLFTVFFFLAGWVP